MYEKLNIVGPLEDSKNLLNWVATRLDGLRVPDLPDNKRLQMALACQHIAIEHAQAIIVLIDNKIYGSALALQRPLYEAMVHGLWLRHSAMEEEVDKAAEGIFPKFQKMANITLPTKDQNNAKLLKDLKDEWWNLLCNYTHGGAKQILARFNCTGLCSNYRRNEVMVALHLANFIQLYSGFEMAESACNESLAMEFSNRMATYELIS